MSVFSFLGNAAKTVGHDVGTVAHGNSNPGGGVFGFLANATKTAFPQTTHPQTNPNSHPISLAPNPNNFGPALSQAQGIARTVPETAQTIIHPFSQSTYTPGSPIEQAAFGSTPVQNIQAKVATNYQDHPGLNPVLRVGLAGAEGAASVAQDAPVFGFLAKEAEAGAKTISAADKAISAKFPATQNLNVGKLGLSTQDVGSGKLAQDLVKAATPKDAFQTLIKSGVDANTARKIAPAVAQTKDPNIIKNIIDNAHTPPPSPAEVAAAKAPIELPGIAGQGSLDSLGQSDAAKKITDTLAEAQKTRNLQEQSYSAERSARLGQSQAAGVDLPGLAGHRAELSALKGELGKQQYEGLAGHLAPPEQDNLFTQLRQEIKDNPDIQGYAKLNTAEAARKVIYGDAGVPTNSELGLLRNAFGDNFSEAVKGDIAAHNEKLNAVQTFGQNAAQVAGLPRELMATADFSGGLRQGLAAATRHPLVFAKAFGKQFKYFASESAYHDAEKAIYDHPDYPLLHQSGTAILELDKKLGPTEERFVSNLGEKIPGVGKLVRGSNRAYTGLLNNMRANIFYDKAATLRNAGYDLNSPENAKLVKDLGTVINTSTGRGDLGRFEAAGHALSTALFAPRLIASRLSMLDPRYYINLEPVARKEALTTLLSLGAFGTGILSLAELAGGKVSKDPTNADFGKVRIGDTRIDPLGGFAQYIRLGAQLAEGKKTNSTTGATTELGKGIAGSRWDVFTNFLANKEAPVPSFVTTALKGKDAAGNPINYSKEIRSRFEPLLAQDIQDLYSHDNAVGGSTIGKPLAAVAGAFGAGLQTYSAQDNPLSTKQKTYISTLKQNGADQQTVKASTSFFQDLKEAAGTRTNVNSAIDSAIKNQDLPKAQQLAEQYNKELSAGMTKWAQQYGEQYGNSDLQQAYDHQKINLSPTSIQTRIKALNSTKPF